MGGAGGSSNDNYVWSTYHQNDYNYVGLTGTSQATPLVSGVAALMFAANPNLSSAQAVEILTSRVDPINGNGSYAYKDASSAGLVWRQILGCMVPKSRTQLDNVRDFGKVPAALEAAADTVRDRRPPTHDLAHVWGQGYSPSLKSRDVVPLWVDMSRF